jgi:hypothetical protein
VERQRGQIREQDCSFSAPQITYKELSNALKAANRSECVDPLYLLLCSLFLASPTCACSGGMALTLRDELEVNMPLHDAGE